MFAPQLDGLSDTYRVIAYDQRSRTARWDEAYTLADLADDLLGLLDELEGATCVLVGTSVGGFIAQELALARPERLASLILVSPYAAPDAWAPRVLAARRQLVGP